MDFYTMNLYQKARKSESVQNDITERLELLESKVSLLAEIVEKLNQMYNDDEIEELKNFVISHME